MQLGKWQLRPREAAQTFVHEKAKARKMFQKHVKNALAVPGVPGGHASIRTNQLMSDMTEDSTFEAQSK